MTCSDNCLLSEEELLKGKGGSRIRFSVGGGSMKTTRSAQIASFEESNTGCLQFRDYL